MSPLRRHVLSALLVVAAFPGGAPAAAEDPVVELPPMIVTNTGRLRPWHYASMRGYEVLSRTTDRNTREFMAALHRMEFSLRAIVPEQLQLRSEVPDIVILSESSETGEGTKEIVLGAAGDPAEARRVRFLPNLALNDLDARVVFALVDPGRFDADPLTFTEGRVAFLLERRAPALPRWYIEGVLGVWRDLQFRDAEVRIAPFDWISEDERARLRAEPDAPRTFVAWHELLAWGRLPAPADRATQRLWASQAALLVRWALDGPPQRRARFWRLVARAAERPVTEALLEECLGYSFADLNERLSDYLPVAITTEARLPLPERPKPPRVEPREPTSTELSRIKAEWERLVVVHIGRKNPEYLSRYRAQVDKTIADALARGERDPVFFATLGLYHVEQGDFTSALPYLQAAAHGQVARPRVYLELARARLASWRRMVADRATPMTAEAANDILAPLHAARQLRPVLPDTYMVAADVWSRSRVQLGQQNLAALQEGIRLFPDHSGLLYANALLQLSRGAFAEAEEFARRGQRYAPTPMVRQQFAALEPLIARAREGITAPTPAP